MTVMATVTDLRQDEGRAACASVSALRVLYLFPGRPEGSAMIFAKKQVEAIETLRVAAEAFCLESRTDLSGLRRDASRLRDVIASFRPDLLHAQYGTMTAFFATVAANVPMVVTFRGSDLNPAPSDPWLRSLAGRLLSHLAARRAAGLICVSEQLKRRLWWGRERALVLPSGVDIELFQPHPQAEARRELGWSQEERIVLFNAGLSPMVKREDLAQAAVLEAERLCGRITVVRLDGFVPQRRVVAMMNVPVDDEDSFQIEFLLSMPSGNGNVIEQAESHRPVGQSVVSRRSDQTECPMGAAGGDEMDRLAGGAGRLERDIQGKRADNRVRIEPPPAGKRQPTNPGEMRIRVNSPNLFNRCRLNPSLRA